MEILIVSNDMSLVAANMPVDSQDILGQLSDIFIK